jgi:hypothetical protein
VKRERFRSIFHLSALVLVVELFLVLPKNQYGGVYDWIEYSVGKDDVSQFLVSNLSNYAPNIFLPIFSQRVGSGRGHFCL